MKDKKKLLDLVTQIMELDEWKFIHVKVGTPVGNTEFFFANPIQPASREKPETILERAVRVMKTQAEGRELKEEDQSWIKDVQYQLATQGKEQLHPGDTEDQVAEKLAVIGLIK